MAATTLVAINSLVALLTSRNASIEKLVDGLGLELFTEVINWEEMKDLQAAFLRSGIPDQDLPQDAAFFSGLYKFARQYKVKHIITGSNFSTECCREPEAWGGYLGIDTTLFGDIHRQFGRRPLDTFPLTDILVYKLYYQKLLGMKVHHPLNLVPYIKKDAEDELNRRFGIAYVSSVKKEHIKLVREGGVSKLNIAYEVRVPLFGNLDVVGKFDHTVDLTGRPSE